MVLFFYRVNMIKQLYYDLVFKIKPPRVGVIATLTRSGTWYCRCFFFAFHKLLNGDKFDSTELVREFYAEDREFRNIKKTIGLDKLIIAHATCPGFKEHYHGNLRDAWDKLEFYGEGQAHDNGDIIMQKPRRKKVYDPYYNRNAKIVYFYRNPLDQAVSFLARLPDYQRKHTMYKKDASGGKVFFTDVKEYIYSAGLDAYIKQFFTFKEMRKIFPKNILMIPYEHLIREPEKTFTALLEHFGYEAQSEWQKVKVRQAIELASQENLKKAEQKLGMSLANEGAPGTSHMRGGAVGKWKDYFDEIDLDKIEKRMAEFNLSLKDCVIE